MTARILSATTLGFDGKLIEVECDASNGLPNLLIVGLGGKAIDEARERVRSAIKNSNLEFPRKRITINLAPADLPKQGTHFDLPIALALLCISGQIEQRSLKNVLIAGELGLDGTLRPVRGIISIVQTALNNGIDTVIVPYRNLEQASLVAGATLLPARDLNQVVMHFTDQSRIPPPEKVLRAEHRTTHSPTLHDIHGQQQAKRALLIAAAGHHNILFSGPPGAGKTMLAKSLVSLLPPLSPQEVVEVTKLHNLAGEVDESVVVQRPFRSPHHSASHVAIVGGGQRSRPGEISLAHRGVLFLDELPEYNRQTLESLRQPLEDKIIHVSRASIRATYPAACMLVATQNPCPCGFSGDQTQECTCSAAQIAAYQKKVSGPLLDRIDLHLTLSRVDHKDLLTKAEPTVDYESMVTMARLTQTRRLGDGRTNASITNQESKNLQLQPDAKLLLDKAASALRLSARAYFKVIKVARTIADLEQSSGIEAVHLSEALQYRHRTI